MYLKTVFKFDYHNNIINENQLDIYLFSVYKIHPLDIFYSKYYKNV